MTRFLQNILITLLGTTIIYLLFFWATTSLEYRENELIYYANDYLVWKGGKSYVTFREFDKNKNYDVVVLGSSHAYRGYDPRIFEKFGYSMFNLGTSGQTPMNTYYIVQDLIDSSNTDFVIFDIYEGTFSGSGLECTSDLTMNYPDDGAAIRMGGALKDIRAVNMLTLRFLRKNDTLDYLPKETNINGYYRSNDTMDSDPDFNASEFEAPQKQYDHFESVLRYLNEQDIPVVVASHPLPKVEARKKLHKSFRKAVTPTLEEYGTPYFDHTLKHDLNSYHYFKDESHLNQNGVSKYNRFLIDELIDNGFLSGE